MAHNLLYPVDRSYLSAALITCWFTKNAPNYKDSFISLDVILKWCNHLGIFVVFFFFSFFMFVKKQPEHK